MGKYIVQRDGWYFEWSTVSDAPSTFGMRRGDFEAYYRDEYGRKGAEDLPSRLGRADAVGTSALDCASAEAVISCNRAGYGETKLTLDEIVQIYCVEQREPRQGEGREPDMDTEVWG